MQIIKEINDWIFGEEDTPQLFLLHGAAGTGKSAISHTIGRQMEEQNCLGAFFCFNRSLVEHRTPGQALKTIAFYLGLCNTNFLQSLLKILESKPQILSSTIEDFWDNLIEKPANMAHGLTQSLPVVIIFDALDESALAQGHREKLLSILINQVSSLPWNYRVLVTSRTEDYILDLLTDFESKIRSKAMEDLQGTGDDIQAYVHHKMRKSIQKKDLTESQCAEIGRNAEGYFQWAYTVCEALCGKLRPGVNIRHEFKRFIALAPNAHDLQPLDKLYKAILESIFRPDDKDAMEGYKTVMSQALSAYEPLSQESLAVLQLAYFQHINGNEEEPTEDTVIPALGALLVGVHQKNVPVYPVHTSVRDFLLDKKRSREYYINLEQGNQINAIGSLKLMTEELHFNMCNLKSSHVLNLEVTNLSEIIRANISLVLQYACSFWSAHLASTRPNENYISLLSKFFNDFLLFWLEVLSLLNKYNVISEAMDNVISWISSTKVCYSEYARV